MAEILSDVVLTDAFAERFDGFSIGSNDPTQLVRDRRRLVVRVLSRRRRVDSIWVTPDSFIAITHEVAAAERERSASAPQR